IERLADLVKRRSVPPGPLIGIGDDAAAWAENGSVALARTDTMVEGIHFIPSPPWRSLGWKALATNISDIAAMGGDPLFALVSLALPADSFVEDVEELYNGMIDAAVRYGVGIVGGDTSRASAVSVTVALYGRGRRGESGEPLLLRRDTARPGDVIAVTGTLG